MFCRFVGVLWYRQQRTTVEQFGANDNLNDNNRELVVRSRKTILEVEEPLLTTTSCLAGALTDVV